MTYLNTTNSISALRSKTREHFDIERSLSGLCNVPFTQFTSVCVKWLPSRGWELCKMPHFCPLCLHSDDPKVSQLIYIYIYIYIYSSYIYLSIYIIYLTHLFIPIYYLFIYYFLSTTICLPAPISSGLIVLFMNKRITFKKIWT